jgi:hypothetical protein
MQMARAEGHELVPGRPVPWLTNKGHLSAALKGTVPKPIIATLRAIHADLGGDERALEGKRGGSDPVPDFLFPERRWIVELDEEQHFTTARLETFERYAEDIEVAYDVDAYCALARLLHRKADRYRAAKPAVDFPFAGGRRAQRAYFDAVRGLLAPFFGLRIFRVPAPERDAALALSRLASAL